MIAGFLWFVFIVSALLLSLIILIQEGKGGGLGEAFGGMGAETFGVKAAGVNKTTAILATVWVLSAILINKCSYQVGSGDIFDDAPAQESTEGAGAASGSDSGSGGAGEEGK